MAFHFRNPFSRKNKSKTLKRGVGSRNLTSKNRNSANRNKQNNAERIIVKLFEKKSGEEILAEAPANIKDHVRKGLINHGLLKNNTKKLSLNNRKNAAARFVIERFDKKSGKQILAEAPENMKNNVRRELMNAGMVKNNNNA